MTPEQALERLTRADLERLRDAALRRREKAAKLQRQYVLSQPPKAGG